VCQAGRLMLKRLSVATTFALLCLCTGEVPCVVSCVSVGGLSCWSVSLCCHHVRTSLFVHRRSTVCCVLCVSRRVVMLERLSVLSPRSHFSVIPRSTLVLPPCVKIWQTSVAPSKISHLLCCLLQQRSHMAQK
jgi:hypothetical protein